MRIVGGNHRGRVIQAPPGPVVRPTGDRNRESLFNILAHARWSEDGESPVTGAQVLDACCGAGALGLEALSRGAASCLFIDHDAVALAFVCDNIATLGEQGRATVLRADVVRPPRARVAASLAFLDPPYRHDLVAPALMALASGGWFTPDAVVVAEADRRDKIALPTQFEPLDSRDYGHTRLYFLRWRASPAVQ